VIIVGGLTTPLHKIWADAAVAYQEKHFPDMKQATDRFGMGESTDETQKKTVLDVSRRIRRSTGFMIEGSPGRSALAMPCGRSGTPRSLSSAPARPDKRRD